ncbi:Ribonuclease P protein subunit p38 [Acipenser ruthenus]|uniref:Ribonuclease P protein subunit p38 n=1 Tax=Acipenser ruthenus TaxID=7906 RepID=A0A444TZT3_ACIRT|nr:ribonuclease P protein subunit p38-like [Acipenser ruthenus]XP_033848671.1 ribonuclease P protein subunit p38-like [Acipenser ruthenus]XP_033848672.1 ribonuclease P protein subunit p38-like [Acipenser ruthenus]XP_033848673.1 ribonuclease P protein subunit p38-like [Acipenser ruthenus]XP_034776744.1 ribonuclease P protein subunit p38-like [Acipenser ruthenus]RXM28402.1 Ribonuclease P protein subunit p38 [Acipenser ruthenus]
MTTPVRKGLQKVKQVPARTSFNSPYSIAWCSLESEDMHFILQLLQDKFKQTGLQKREPPKRKRKCQAVKKSQSSDQMELEETPHEDTKEMPESMPPVTEPGWTDMSVRKQLAIRINEVTRALERNELCLVLVCKSVKPAHMTNHLIQLSVCHAVPACLVPRLSENIAAVLGLKCALALGFKRNSESFTDEVKAIIPKVPSLQVSWIQQDYKIATEDTSLSRAETVTQEGGQKEWDAELRKKWKLDEDLPEGKELESKELITLQPLKIKKVIPNPQKIRKPKYKKQKN